MAKPVISLELTQARVKYLMSCMTPDMVLRIPIQVGRDGYSWVELNFQTGEYYTAPEIAHLGWTFDEGRRIRAWIEQTFATGICSAHNLDLHNRTPWLTKLQLLSEQEKRNGKSNKWKALVVEFILSFKAFERRFANEVEFRSQFHQLEIKRLNICRPR